MSMTTELAQLKPGNYAILYRDNWDGEGDTYHCLAFLDEEGEWRSFETTAQLLQYEGDEILKAWSLDDGSNVLALVEALETRDKRIAELEARKVKLPDYSETYTTGFASEIEHQVLVRCWKWLA